MKNFKLLMFIVFTLFISACVTQEVTLKNTFIPSEYDSYRKSGTGAIVGQAFLRQRGGGVVNCAGNTVYFMPATPFFREFAQVNAGRSNVEFSQQTKQQVSKLIRQTKCNANGNFGVGKLAEGRWIVTVKVSWVAGKSSQGGWLGGETDVFNGKKSSAILSGDRRL